MGGQAVETQRDVPVGNAATVGAVLLLSLGSGFVAFVGVGLLVWAVSAPVKLALGASGIVVLGVWALTVGKWYSLFWASEVTRPVDQVDDQVTRSVVSVELHNQGRWAFADLPATADQVSQLARGLLAGRSFSEGEWCGQGQPFTRPEYRALRSELVERGLVVWRSPGHPQQGTQLTLAGRQVFRRLSEELPMSRAHACVSQGTGIALPPGAGKGGEHD